MRFGRPRKGERIAPSLIGAICAGYVLGKSGPLLTGAQISPVPSVAALALFVCACVLASDLLWRVADLLDWIEARRPKGLKGTAGWARLKDLKVDLIKWGWGPYWGVLETGWWVFKRRKALLADYASNALTVGTAGSGKGVGVVQPTIMAIQNASKTIIDFKGEQTCVLAEELRRRGEIVRILNIGDVWPEVIGMSDTYNPLVILAENYLREGGLLDISDDVHEMCMQLLPEPADGGGKDGDAYFRNGSRGFIAFAMQTCAMIHGENATLGDVAQMLNDRSSLLKHALWASGKLVKDDE